MGSFVQLSAAAQPDFSISASPATQTVVATMSTSYTVTVSAIAGFTGTATMSVSGLPTGSTASFNPPTVTGSGSSALAVNTAVSTPLGNYTLTITAVSGGITHTANVNLMVVGAPAPPIVP